MMKVILKSLEEVGAEDNLCIGRFIHRFWTMVPQKKFKNPQLWGTGFCFSAQPYRKKIFFWQIASVWILGIEGKLWLVPRCKVAIQCTLLKFSTYQHPLKYFFTVSKITCSLLRLLSNDSKPPNNIFVLSLVICLCCNSLEGFSNKVALNF